MANAIREWKSTQIPIHGRAIAVLALLSASISLAAEVSPKNNIVENAAGLPDHTTLVAALRAGDLMDLLGKAGPYTLFAPTNEAFKRLPEGTVEKLLLPQNHEQLAKILRGHIVAGDLSRARLTTLIQAGGGHTTLQTVGGEKLEASLNSNTIVLKDATSGLANLTQADVRCRNGLIQVVDAVLMPAH